MRYTAFLVIAISLIACDGPAGVDAGVDSGGRDSGPDTGPPDSGPPPPMVPLDGWTNAIESSNIAASITSSDGLMTFDNMEPDPLVVIGEPDSMRVALGDMGHGLVADLGAGEEAYDGPGDDIEILEQDLFHGGGVPEAYTVSVAATLTDGFTVLGDAMGTSHFDLAGTGLGPIRYIRVESTATADEIIDGPGSETFPGPEIDAIGAYYPGGVP